MARAHWPTTDLRPPTIAHRQRKKWYVESAQADLRNAPWACVERVHTVAQADLQADDATTSQITRVHTANHGIETGAVKDEVR